MPATIRQDKAWLLATARALAKQLKIHSQGTRLRIKQPERATSTNTDGWSAVLGNLGKGQPRLELWLDRFSGYPERKLFACFRSEVRAPVVALARRVSKKLWPARVVTMNDTVNDEFVSLTQRLGRSEFNVPILENYEGGRTFYGIYDQTRLASERINPHFLNRAVAFFEDVARSLPNATQEDEQSEVFPQHENRKHVASHLLRERSRLLATERKILDDYKCQACGMRFEHVYGKRLGQGFAEAHHLVPLSQLKGEVRTRIEDLRTVCANCHRMLHRMDGKRGDLEKLRKMLAKRPKRRAGGRQGKVPPA